MRMGRPSKIHVRKIKLPNELKFEEKIKISK